MKSLYFQLSYSLLFDGIHKVFVKSENYDYIYTFTFIIMNDMDKIALKQVYYEGITMQIPEIWNAESETYNEEDGTDSYSLSINASGNDPRSIDISWGSIPEGSDAYNEACATYEEVMSEEDLVVNEEPILCFSFQDREAYGFNVWTDEGLPCFFFCLQIPSDGRPQLLTVLVSAPDNDELQSLIDFVEEYLQVA